MPSSVDAQIHSQKSRCTIFFALEKLPKTKNPTTTTIKTGCRKKHERRVAAVSAVEEDATQGPFMVNEVRLKTVSHFSGDQQAANDHISERLEYVPKTRRK